jgi:exosortase
LLLLLIGIGLNWASTYYYYTLLGAFSLLPTLAGLAVLAFGADGLKWAGPSIAFLFFMIPLPGMFSGLLAHPLQRLATECSTYLLQLFGIAAVAEGNIILLSEGRIGVVEACSGLRMLILFFAISGAVAMLIRRPLWERLFVLASAAPIALSANIIRITATGILHETCGAAVADGFFHTVGGLVMGPLALGLLFLEMMFLSRALLPNVSGPLTLATDGGAR